MNKFLKEGHIPDYLPEDADVENESLRESEKLKEIYGFAHELNRIGRNYNQDDILNLCQLHLISKEKVEKAFKRVFDNHKDAFGLANKEAVDKVLYFIKKKYNLSQNIVSGKLENNGEEFLFADLVISLQRAKIKYSNENLRLLLESSEIERLDPFRHYFDNLPKWNGKDNIAELASYIKTDNDDFFLPMLKKMLVRSISCGLGEEENRYIMVFCGEQQSIGKSRLVRWLNPMGIKYFAEGLKKNDKDMNVVLGRNFMVNLDELNSLAKYDLSRVKEMISMSSINEREAFRRDANQMPRRGNFWGTTNEADFLIDTSNTRWLIFETSSIDWKGYTSKVDKDQLWAQAYWLYRSEMFDPQLSIEERAVQEVRNKSFENQSMEKEFLTRYFTHGDDFTTTSEIMEILQLNNPIRLERRFIGKELKRLGFEKTRRRINNQLTYGYMIKLKKGAAIVEEESPDDSKLF